MGRAMTTSSVDKGPMRGIDGGVGVGGGVELPDLAAGVGVLHAEAGVYALLRDPQAPHPPILKCTQWAPGRAREILIRGGRPSLPPSPLLSYLSLPLPAEWGGAHDGVGYARCRLGRTTGWATHGAG